MAKTATVTAIRNKILEKAALGNSKRGLKEVASDLVNQVSRDKKATRMLCEGTFLCKATLDRVRQCDENYRPQADTLERIFRYFNAEVHFTETHIKPRYQNKPKGE